MSNTHKCCQRQKLRRGLWSPDEDEKLLAYIVKHGPGNWSSVPERAGIERCGKSCRLRWINYLRPDLKRGSYSELEESRIIELHKIYGNKWSKIASHLPGRTDNEIKNLWNSSLRKRVEKKSSTCRILPTMGPLRCNENVVQLSQVSKSITGPWQVPDTNSLACSSSLPIFPFHPIHTPPTEKHHALPFQEHNVDNHQAALIEAPRMITDKLGLIAHNQVRAGDCVKNLSRNVLPNLHATELLIAAADDCATQNSLHQTQQNDRLLQTQNQASYMQVAARHPSTDIQNNASQHHSKETHLWFDHLIEDHSSLDDGNDPLRNQHQYDTLVSNTSPSTSSTCSDDSSINVPFLLEYADVREFWLEEASYQL